MAAFGGTLDRWVAGLAGRAAPEGPTHIAFGTFCHIAAALRDCGLRRWTGPLDWIFSSPAMISACLDDGFATLLDPARLESVPPEELAPGAKRQCRHRLFEERYELPVLFNHHDLVRYPADRRAVESAVGRLRDALAGEGANLLYMMSERFWPADEVGALAERLAHYRSRNLLLEIELDGRGHERAWSLAPEAQPGLRKVTLTTGSRSRGAAFVEAADDAFLRQALPAIAAEALRG